MAYLLRYMNIVVGAILVLGGLFVLGLVVLGGRRPRRMTLAQTVAFSVAMCCLGVVVVLVALRGIGAHDVTGRTAALVGVAVYASGWALMLVGSRGAFGGRVGPVVPVFCGALLMAPAVGDGLVGALSVLGAHVSPLLATGLGGCALYGAYAVGRHVAEHGFRGRPEAVPLWVRITLESDRAHLHEVHRAQDRWERVSNVAHVAAVVGGTAIAMSLVGAPDAWLVQSGGVVAVIGVVGVVIARRSLRRADRTFDQAVAPAIERFFVHYGIGGPGLDRVRARAQMLELVKAGFSPEDARMRIQLEN